VDEVIGRMDEYYLSREDWDTILELGVDTHNMDLVAKKISTATKSAFTRKYVHLLCPNSWLFNIPRRYNATEHPIPFHKATDLGKAPKKLAGGPAPDLEEVFEVSIVFHFDVFDLTRVCYQVDDEIPDASDSEEGKGDDSDDLTKDSLIKVPKKKKAPAAKGKTKK
jgi:replication factor C subunit 1